MLLLQYFFLMASSVVPGSQVSPEAPSVEIITPAETPQATYSREEEVSYVEVDAPENTTSMALFITFCVLLGVTLIAIIVSVIYLCVITRNNSQIGAADYELSDQVDDTTTKPKTRSTVSTAVSGTRTMKMSMKTTTIRPGTSTTHAKSIYTVNTVIL